jgi:Suppressor of fused protein (SUFU)
MFGRKQAAPEAKPQVSQEDFERYYAHKTAALEAVLGPMADTVGHAIVPFAMGGAVDMYYFPNALPGTAFVTMELVEPGQPEPMPGPLGPYEFIGFTKLPYSSSESPEWQSIERRLCGIFSMLGLYSRQAVLKPGDTMEMPADETHDAKCLVFDAYVNPAADFVVDGRAYGLLLVIEVLRSEMEFAMQEGTGELLDRLKAAGHYSYSDLSREPVA